MFRTIQKLAFGRRQSVEKMASSNLKRQKIASTSQNWFGIAALLQMKGVTVGSIHVKGKTKAGLWFPDKEILEVIPK